MRKDNPIMVYGSYKPVFEEDKNIIAYLRQYGNTKWFIIANFYGNEAETKIPSDYKIKDEILTNMSSNTRINNGAITLSPFEARVFLVE